MCTCIQKCGHFAQGAHQQVQVWLYSKVRAARVPGAGWCLFKLLYAQMAAPAHSLCHCLCQLLLLLTQLVGKALSPAASKRPHAFSIHHMRCSFLYITVQAVLRMHTPGCCNGDMLAECPRLCAQCLHFRLQLLRCHSTQRCQLGLALNDLSSAGGVTETHIIGERQKGVYWQVSSSRGLPAT